MILGLLLPSDLSHGLRSCRIKIVSDNAISQVHSWSELVQPPVQLAPFGSSWMKFGSCPAKVKDRMKLQVTGTRLAKQERRWRASIHQRGPASLFSKQDERDGGGLLRKCRSESNLFSHSSTPKMPVRTISPKKKTTTMKSACMTKATCDVMKGSTEPLTLRRRSSLAHTLQGPPSLSPDSGIDANGCGNLVSVSTSYSGRRMQKCTECVESPEQSRKTIGTRNGTTAMAISSSEPSGDNNVSNLFGKQGRRATAATSRKITISSECSREDEGSSDRYTETNSSAGDSSTRAPTPNEVSVTQSKLTTEVVHYSKLDMVNGGPVRRVCSVESCLNTISLGNANCHSTTPKSYSKSQNNFHHQEPEDTTMPSLFSNHNDSLTLLSLDLTPESDFENECQKERQRESTTADTQ